MLRLSHSLSQPWQLAVFYKSGTGTTRFLRDERSFRYHGLATGFEFAEVGTP
jgi:hypothetical protein